MARLATHACLLNVVHRKTLIDWLISFAVRVGWLIDLHFFSLTTRLFIVQTFVKFMSEWFDWLISFIECALVNWLICIIFFRLATRCSLCGQWSSLWAKGSKKRWVPQRKCCGAETILFQFGLCFFSLRIGISALHSVLLLRICAFSITGCPAFHILHPTE